MRAAREAVKVEKAQDLMRLAGDVGRVQSKAGTRAALDALKLAEGPRDMSRIARLAAAKGGKTRAILKLAGRGAIVLTVGTFNLAMWMFWAMLTVLGFVSSLKRMTERTTERYCARRKLRLARKREQLACQQARAGAACGSARRRRADGHLHDVAGARSAPAVGLSRRGGRRGRALRRRHRAARGPQAGPRLGSRRAESIPCCRSSARRRRAPAVNSDRCPVPCDAFAHDGVEIAFLDEGAGEPIVLVHGFASNAQVNWVHPGWVATLTRAGRRVIALDNRGHGASSKLYDPAAYHSAVMAEDVRALLDHLELGTADVMGYSMGARITAFLALAHPARVRKAVLGGLGMHLVDGVGLPESIAEALEAPSLADVRDPQGRMFRAFAEQTKSDLTALAACIRGSRQTLSREQVASIRMPVLVAVGTKDTVAGPAHELAALLPRGRALDIPGRDHMLAVGDKVFKEGVLAFLAEPP